MTAKNIIFANLIQNTKELHLNIPWKKFTSQKDKLLYAKADVNEFSFYADLSYIQEDSEEETCFYGFGLSLKPVKLPVLPNVLEDSEVIFEIGFYRSQKEGLKQYLRLKEVLKGFSI